MAITVTQLPNGVVQEYDPTWSVPMTPAPAATGVLQTPVPNAAVSLRNVSAAPMVQEGVNTLPARPILNRRGPTQVAWAADPVNGSVSPLVGAYSAYPHVVYAPQYLGAAGLLDVVSRAVQNNPYAQQAMMMASAAGRQGGGMGGGAGRSAGVSGVRGSSKTQAQAAGPKKSDFSTSLGVDITPSLASVATSEGPYPAQMPEETVLDTSYVSPIPDTDVLNRDATTGELATALSALGIAEGTGALALARALALDETVRQFGVYGSGDPNRWKQLLTSPTGKSLFRNALGRIAAGGLLPLNLILGAQAAIDYGRNQGMNLEDWNTDNLPEDFEPLNIR